jgi:integrase
MGFRRAEVFGLTLEHFDPHSRGVWLSHAETKGKRSEFIPASEMAFEILSRLAARARELGQRHLILYRTGGVNVEVKWRPIKFSRSAWKNVLKKLGLTGRHKFHNTKATFVTAVAQKMPAAVVQDLARHRDFATTMRYISVADATRRQGVDCVAGQLFFTKPEKPLALPEPERSHKQNPHTDGIDEVGVTPNYLIKMVGMAGFEPTTPSPPD